MRFEVASKIATANERSGREFASRITLPAVVFILLLATSVWAAGQTSGGTTGSTGSGSPAGSGSGTSGATGSTGASGSSQDWSSVQSAMGFNGQIKPSGVFKVQFSRQDEQFTEKGFKRQPEFFASGWIAFSMQSSMNGSTGTGAAGGSAAGGSAAGAAGSGTASGSGAAGGSASGGGQTAPANLAMITAEIPLLETEVAEFERVLERADIAISAVHNHEIQERPRLIFIHAETVGDPVQVAQVFRTAMSRTRAKFAEDTGPDTHIAGLDRNTIFHTIGNNAEATAHDGVLEVTVPRSEQFSNCTALIVQATNGPWAANSNNGSNSNNGGGAANGGTASNGGTATSGTSGAAAGSSGTAAGGSTSTASSAGPGLMASNGCLSASMQSQPGAQGASGSGTGTSGTGTSGSTGTSGTGTSGSTGSTGTSGTGSASGGTSAGAGSGSTSGQSGANNFPADLGAASEFHFELGGNGSVDVNAEFALLATEVQQTVRILRENNFTVSALHNHFISESPRLFFIHASGHGSASKLAQVIRMVLDQNAMSSGTSGSASGTGTSGSTGSSTGTGPGF